jgi:hypothetical protein
MINDCLNLNWMELICRSVMTQDFWTAYRKTSGTSPTFDGPFFTSMPAASLPDWIGVGRKPARLKADGKPASASLIIDDATRLGPKRCLG